MAPKVALEVLGIGVDDSVSDGIGVSVVSTTGRVHTVAVSALDTSTLRRLCGLVKAGRVVGMSRPDTVSAAVAACHAMLASHGVDDFTFAGSDPSTFVGRQETAASVLDRQEGVTASTTAPMAPSVDAATDALAEAVRIITEASRGGTDEDRVRAIFAEMIDAHRPSTTITIGDLPTVDLGDEIVHESFEKVVRTLVRFPVSGRSAFLYGPPGSGKTYTAEQAARAVGLSCAIVACEPSLMPSALRGFIDATGTYRGTAFRDAYENGGVIVFDEVDNAPPSITVGLINAAVTASSMVFPDGVVRRSPMFRVIMTGNTDGNGPTAGFSGRFPLDRSTNDRTRPIFYGYDERVLRAMVGAVVDADTTDAIVAAVHKIRENLTEAGIGENITPRAALAAAVMVADGETWEDIVSEALLPAGVRNGDNRRRAMANVVPFA